MTTYKHVKTGHFDLGDGLLKLGTIPSITKDIGWYSQYADPTDTVNPIKYTGLIRSKADGSYHLFDQQTSVATANDPETLTINDALTTAALTLGTLSANTQVNTSTLNFNAPGNLLGANQVQFPVASGLVFADDNGTKYMEIDPTNNQVSVLCNLVAQSVNLTISGISTHPGTTGQYTGNLDIEGSAIKFNDTTSGYKNQIQFPSVSGFEILASDSSYGIQFSNNSADYAIPHTIGVTAANIELRGDTHQFSGFNLNVETLTPTAANSTTILDGTSSIFRVDATVGATTLQLPSASSNLGRVYKIIKIDSTAATVSIIPPTGQNIDQSTSSIVFDTQFDNVALVSDGFQWYTGL
jgi:stringent starvation protein B